MKFWQSYCKNKTVQFFCLAWYSHPLRLFRWLFFQCSCKFTGNKFRLSLGCHPPWTVSPGAVHPFPYPYWRHWTT